MAEENKYGRIFHFMKAIGKITKPMEGDDLFILMGMFIKENGKMIKPMVKVFITITMAPAIMESGIKMYNKVLVSKNGLMDLLMKGTSLII